MFHLNPLSLGPSSVSCPRPGKQRRTRGERVPLALAPSDPVLALFMHGNSSRTPLSLLAAAKLDLGSLLSPIQLNCRVIMTVRHLDQRCVMRHDKIAGRVYTRSLSHIDVLVRLREDGIGSPGERTMGIP